MNLHPMFAHLPLTLRPVAPLLLLLAWWRGGERWLFAAKASLFTGVIGVLVAVVTGWSVGESIPHNDAIHRMMETHQYAAIIVFIVATMLVVWNRWLIWAKSQSLGWFVAALALANGLLVSVDDLGARMVYQRGAGVIPAVRIIPGGSPEIKGGDGRSESGDFHKEHRH
ncbi:MAG: hypothetical protein M5U32_11805 [Myxococcota bacterium]|nr:hypothetical protein [Myxococcota bacterium]